MNIVRWCKEAKRKPNRRCEEGDRDKGNWVHVVWARCCHDSVVKLKSRGRRVRGGRREDDGQGEWERKRKMIKGGGCWGGLLGKETFFHGNALSLLLPMWFFVIYVLSHIRCRKSEIMASCQGCRHVNNHKCLVKVVATSQFRDHEVHLTIHLSGNMQMRFFSKVEIWFCLWCWKSA